MSTLWDVHRKLNIDKTTIGFFSEYVEIKIRGNSPYLVKKITIFGQFLNNSQQL